MPKLSRYPLSSKEIEKLSEHIVDATLLARKKEELTYFFNDLLTRTEKAMLGKRLLIAIFLEKGYSYAEISRWLKVSQVTIGTVKEKLANDGRGFKLVLKRLESEKRIDHIFERMKQMFDRLPSKTGHGRWRFLRT